MKTKISIALSIVLLFTGVLAWRHFSKPVETGLPSEVVNEINGYFKEAKDGSPDAQFKVGTLYEDGKQLKQDFPSAALWYRKAAKQGHLEAQEKLASILYNGKGTPVNYAEARIWYTKAAEQGSLNAQLKIGLMFKEGQGVQVDFKEAKKWYDLAAEQDSPEAIKELDALINKMRKQEQEEFERQYQERG